MPFFIRSSCLREALGYRSSGVGRVGKKTIETGALSDGIQDFAAEAMDGIGWNYVPPDVRSEAERSSARGQRDQR